MKLHQPLPVPATQQPNPVAHWFDLEKGGVCGEENRGEEEAANPEKGLLATARPPRLAVSELQKICADGRGGGLEAPEHLLSLFQNRLFAAMVPFETSGSMTGLLPFPVDYFSGPGRKEWFLGGNLGRFGNDACRQSRKGLDSRPLYEFKSACELQLMVLRGLTLIEIGWIAFSMGDAHRYRPMVLMIGRSFIVKGGLWKRDRELASTTDGMRKDVLERRIRKRERCEKVSALSVVESYSARGERKREGEGERKGD